MTIYPLLANVTPLGLLGTPAFPYHPYLSMAASNIECHTIAYPVGNKIGAPIHLNYPVEKATTASSGSTWREKSNTRFKENEPSLV